MSDTGNVPLLAMLEFRGEVRYRNNSGPDAFEAPLSHERIVTQFVATLLDSSLAWSWFSRSNEFGEPSSDNKRIDIRPFCLLDRLNQKDLYDDMREASHDDGYGREIILVGGSSEQVSSYMGKVSSCDIALDSRYADSGSYEELVKKLLTGLGGLEILIYNPGDTWEYLLINKPFSAEVQNLIEGKWGLLTVAKEKKPALWAKKTWSGRWGEARVLPT